MPKINVYLPDDLAAAVREARLSVSPICQKALAEAVRVVAGAREAVEALRDPEFDPHQHPQISARIAGRMTGHLGHALQLARDFTGSHGLVEAEDLLVGVLDEPDNLGIQVLQSLDVDIRGLRDAATRAGGARGREATPRRSRARGSRPTRDGSAHQRDQGLLDGLSAGARLAIAAALEAAIDLGHDYVGCEHLVLGLTEAEGAAGALLRELGIESESIHRAIPALVGAAALGYANAHRILAPAVAERLDDVDRRLEEFEERLKAGGL
jgi:ATP-dependent Clp protease ATP-binding subunit ClpC